MSRNNFFQFKQFRVFQEKSGMKVGVDGVLLGAWANLERARQILDVGTGTGLLALMAAQRSGATIDAVELEPEAAAEAYSNFQSSEWLWRFQLSVGAFQNFQTHKKYDHIISNPPFFDNSQKSADVKRAQARHADSLSLKELLEKSKEYLDENGKISLILPADKEMRLLELSQLLNLKLTRITRVASDETKKIHRLLVELSLTDAPLEDSTFFIRDAATGNYSTGYRELTTDFYLSI